MKALQFSEKGNLDSLRWCDVPMPSLSPDQVLVEVKACGLNPSDVKNVLGLFPYTSVPRVAGRDFAGVVVEGPASWLGKSVFGCALENGFVQDGSHAQYMAVSLDALIEKPEQLSFAQAASLGVPYATAFELIERAGLPERSKVLVLGAGAVAQAVAKLLQVQGQSVVFAARRPKVQQALQQAGATCLALTADLPAQVQQHWGGLADLVFDSTGFQLDVAVQCAVSGGQLGVIAAPANGEITFPVKDFYRKGLTMIGVNSLRHNNKICNDYLRQILPLLARAELVLDEPKTIALAQGAEAYVALHEGVTEKVVMIP